MSENATTDPTEKQTEPDGASADQVAKSEAGAPAPAPQPAADEEEPVDSIFGEFMLFLREEKKWWLAPLVLVLLLLSAVIIFAEGSAIAPFIYTIF